MTATPAQIANDMTAHAAYWKKRDDYVARTCEIAAMVIRGFMNDERIDGRTFGGLHTRLMNLSRRRGTDRVWGWPNFDRVETVIFALRAEAEREGR